MMSLPLDNASAVLEASTLVVAALFPIVNPIGSAAVFLALVDRFDSSLQIRLAKKIAVYGFFLLFISMLVGGKILSFLAFRCIRSRLEEAWSRRSIAGRSCPRTETKLTKRC
jgi:hypothetical protein